MADSLLRSLRTVMLDESEPLAGLLRKCLLLGAETGSTALRGWARRELQGYSNEDEVPGYRKVAGVPMFMDSVSGNTWAQNQSVSRIDLPKEAWDLVPDELLIRQPVEELEKLAGSPEHLRFSSPGLAYARSLWNQKLGPFQSVHSLSYAMSSSTITGILGQIRTQLVDMIADLTADTPLTELPGKEQVDAAVHHHIGDLYNTTIEQSAGPVAIGSKATAKSEGLSVPGALELLDAVRTAANEARGADVDALLNAVEELREAVDQTAPDPDEVVKKAGALRKVADKVGIAAISAATSSATTALTELAMGGALG